MGSTWWLILVRSDSGQGPHHSRFRDDQHQKSKKGFGGGFLHFGMLNLADRACEGDKNRLDVRFSATEWRMEVFLALAAKPFRAAAVLVLGRKTLTYASMSCWGGGGS